MLVWLWFRWMFGLPWQVQTAAVRGTSSHCAVTDRVSKPSSSLVPQFGRMVPVHVSPPVLANLNPRKPLNLYGSGALNLSPFVACLGLVQLFVLFKETIVNMLLHRGVRIWPLSKLQPIYQLWIFGTLFLTLLFHRLVEGPWYWTLVAAWVIYALVFFVIMICSVFVFEVKNPHAKSN